MSSVCYSNKWQSRLCPRREIFFGHPPAKNRYKTNISYYKYFFWNCFPDCQKIYSIFPIEIGSCTKTSLCKQVRRKGFFLHQMYIAKMSHIHKNICINFPRDGWHMPFSWMSSAKGIRVLCKVQTKESGTMMEQLISSP